MLKVVQKIIDFLYRNPRSRLTQIKRMGGWHNVKAIDCASKEMEKAAGKLVCPQISPESPNLEIWFLTGKKFWYQTIFCIKSLIESSQQDFLIHISDDGSLGTALISKMRAQVPFIQIHTKKEIEERLEQTIPRSAFPYLWHKRAVYPHIKKLTDIHAGTTGWKLVLDSDMLFFQRPDVMIQWLQKPDRPFHIFDTQNAYGYSFALMEQLAGNPIPEKLNVGMIGLQSESINWEDISHWIQVLENKEGTNYYLEQALSAMLVARQEWALAGPAEDYIVMPNKEQILYKKGILHHYVDLSKEWYFKNAWRNFTVPSGQ